MAGLDCPYLLGKSFLQLGQAMEGDGGTLSSSESHSDADCPGNYNPGLNNAVVSTGECYEVRLELVIMR